MSVRRRTTLCRNALLVIVLLCCYSGPGSTVLAMPEQCHDTCDWSDSCGETCYAGYSEVTCGMYGVCEQTWGGCGDGYCSSGVGETASNCPADCDLGLPNPPPPCGDAVCSSPAENSRNCPQDCPAYNQCGDGICDFGESTATCMQDCDHAGFCFNQSDCGGIEYYCLGGRCVWGGGGGNQCEGWWNCWGGNEKCVQGICVPAY